MKDSPLFFSRSEDLGTQRFGPAVEYKDKLFKRHAARIRRPSAGFCGVWRRHIMHYVDSGRELPRSAAAFPEELLEISLVPIPSNPDALATNRTIDRSLNFDCVARRLALLANN